MAIGTSLLYMCSSVRRAGALREDNGIQVANNSWWSTIRTASMHAMGCLTVAAAGKMLAENYDLAPKLCLAVDWLKLNYSKG